MCSKLSKTVGGQYQCIAKYEARFSFIHYLFTLAWIPVNHTHTCVWWMWISKKKTEIEWEIGAQWVKYSTAHVHIFIGISLEKWNALELKKSPWLRRIKEKGFVQIENSNGTKWLKCTCVTVWCGDPDRNRKPIQRCCSRAVQSIQCTYTCTFARQCKQQLVWHRMTLFVVILFS